MTDRIQEGGLQVATVLHKLLQDEIEPGTGVPAGNFWEALEAIVADLLPAAMNEWADTTLKISIFIYLKYEGFTC